MSGRTRDRRGDRRAAASTCNELVRTFAGGGPLGRCGGRLADAPDTGRVFCTSCGALDRRSTEGNRRRAELELGALCQRIERELGAFRSTLEEHETRLDGLGQIGEQLEERVERRRGEIHELERKLGAVEDTAERAEREADRARAEAERAGRGW